MEVVTDEEVTGFGRQHAQKGNAVNEKENSVKLTVSNREITFLSIDCFFNKRKKIHFKSSKQKLRCSTVMYVLRIVRNFQKPKKCMSKESNKYERQ